MSFYWYIKKEEKKKKKKQVEWGNGEKPSYKLTFVFIIIIYLF